MKLETSLTMKNPKELKIKKVHLDSFITLLTDLYNRGVDYVDIIGVMDDKQDMVGLSFCKEYMSKDQEENFNDIPVNISNKKNNDEIEIRFSDDDDLNQLI